MARGAKRLGHPLCRPGEHITARPHRAAHHDGLADLAVLGRQIGMSWGEGAGGALAVDEQRSLHTPDDVLLGLCNTATPFSLTFIIFLLYYRYPSAHREHHNPRPSVFS